MNYCFKISTSNLSDFIIIRNLLTVFGTGLVKTIVLPKRLKRFVFIKSPHVNNSSKEHFQLIKYQRLFYVNFSPVSLKKFLTKTPNRINIKIKNFS
jgi:ribosomal protein S10